MSKYVITRHPNTQEEKGGRWEADKTTLIGWVNAGLISPQDEIYDSENHTSEFARYVFLNIPGFEKHSSQLAPPDSHKLGDLEQPVTFNLRKDLASLKLGSASKRIYIVFIYTIVIGVTAFLIISIYQSWSDIVHVAFGPIGLMVVGIIVLVGLLYLLAKYEALRKLSIGLFYCIGVYFITKQFGWVVIPLAGLLHLIVIQSRHVELLEERVKSIEAIIRSRH